MSKPIHVSDELYERIAKEAEERGITKGEVAALLMTGGEPAKPEKDQGLSADLAARLAVYCANHSIEPDAALEKVVDVGLRRIAALEKDALKREASKPPRVPREPKPAKPTKEEKKAREASKALREAVKGGGGRKGKKGKGQPSALLGETAPPPATDGQVNDAASEAAE